MNKHNGYKLIFHFLVTVLCIVVFYYITIKTKPYPFSDFLYYWNYATDLSQYTKGGLLFLFYAPLKLLNIEPYISAFIVNSFCFIALSYSMWLNRESPWQLLSTILLALTGVWFLGFIPIVNTDIPTIALYLFGIRLFMEFLNTRKNLLLILSVISVSISLTMRSQLFYIGIFLVILIIFMTIFQYIKKQKISKSLIYLLILLVSTTIISFSTNQYLVSQNKNTEESTLYMRTTFYTGFLETPSSGPTCGTYTATALERARGEIDIPFSQVLIKGVQKLSLQRITETILCKWNNYLFEYSQSGMTWLTGHLTDGWTNTRTFGNYWGYFLQVENFIAKIIKLASLSLVVIIIYNIKKLQKSEILAFLFTLCVIFMFFAIHTILEIQARYIIPPVMIAMVFSLYIHSGMFKNLP